MSYQATIWAIDRSAGLPAGAWRVLVVLARHADARGENAHPTPESIAERLAMHPRTVQRALRLLEASPAQIQRTGVTPRGVFIYRLLMTPDATRGVAQLCHPNSPLTVQSSLCRAGSTTKVDVGARATVEPVVEPDRKTGGAR